MEELSQDKLSPLLKLKYHHAIAAAVADLGEPKLIAALFADSQKYLHQAFVAA